MLYIPANLKQENHVLKLLFSKTIILKYTRFSFYIIVFKYAGWHSKDEKQNDRQTLSIGLI